MHQHLKVLDPVTTGLKGKLLQLYMKL